MTKHKKLLILASLFAVAIFFFFLKHKSTFNSSDFVKVEITQEGKKDSPQIKLGDTITLRYTNFLDNGTVLDSTESKGGTPFTFKFGETQILKGWNDGLIGAKIGEKRKVTTNYKYAYGEQGAPPKIPPKANIITEFEILNVEHK